METASSHNAGGYNFEIAPRYLENLWTSGLEYLLDESEFDSLHGKEFLSSLRSQDGLWDTEPLIKLIHKFCFSEAKREDSEADHSHLSSVEVKN
jgi:hypothetical protein